jgi:hypothetical protein
VHVAVIMLTDSKPEIESRRTYGGPACVMLRVTYIGRKLGFVKELRLSITDIR